MEQDFQIDGVGMECFFNFLCMRPPKFLKLSSQISIPFDFAPAWLAQTSKIPLKTTGSWSKIRKKKKKKEHYVSIGIICYNVVLFFTFSLNTSSAVTSYPHLPSVVNSHPAVHPGLTATCQYPAVQAKPVLSVFGDGASETKTDWKVPPRKHEDR